VDALHTRHVDLETCCNFRDLGGYPTGDGRRTRWRTLFRADGLTRLSASDRAVLGDLGVRTVIDLRTALEVDTRGRFPEDVAGVAYHHLPLTDTLPGAEAVPDWEDTDFVSRRYASYIDAGAPAVAEALSVLTEPANLPAVFHCSVGKDRTGVLSAVVLGLLGVPDEVIVEDYVLSKAAMVQVLERLQAEFADAAEEVAKYAPVILSVEPGSMAGFLRELRARFGSFDAMAEELGWTATVAALRDRLLDPA
jgi:protein-tyrosine phosphatase